MEHPSPLEHMRCLLTGYWLTQSLYVAAKLGLADSLKDTPRTADDLASVTETHPGALHRLLRALASIGVFAEDPEHRFRDLLDAFPAAVYTTDANGYVTFYNNAAEQLAGRTPEIGRDQWSVLWKLFHSDGAPMALEDCPMAVTLPAKSVLVVEVQP